MGRGVREEEVKRKLVIAANRFAENPFDAEALAEVCDILANGSLPFKEGARIVSGGENGLKPFRKNRKEGEQNAPI